jgi:hypothetical protein
VFRGRFTARTTAGVSRVVVEDGREPHAIASRALVVRSDALGPVDDVQLPLATLSASHGGIDVAPSNRAAVERFIRRTAVPAATRVTVRPMRSPWWLLPFAACVSGDWYARRRRGLR